MRLGFTLAYNLDSDNCRIEYHNEQHDLFCHLGETSKLIGYSLHIQQPTAAKLYRKCYKLLLNAAAFWLQPAVMNFDVFFYGTIAYILTVPYEHKSYVHVTFGCRVFHLADALLGGLTGCRDVTCRYNTSLYESATPFQLQLLLWLQPPDISCILNKLCLPKTLRSNI